MTVLRLATTGEIVGSRDQVAGESCSIGKGREQSWEVVESPDRSGHGHDCFEHVQNSRGQATVNFSRTRFLLPSYCSRDDSRD